MAEAVKIIKRQKQREKSFDRFMRAEDVERLLQIRPFKDMDEKLFPSSNPLREILLKDTRILRFEEGEVVLRQGEYGESAFLLLFGQITLFWDLDAEVLGFSKPEKKGVFEALGQLFSRQSLPEMRDLGKYKIDQDLAYLATGNKEENFVFIEDVEKLKEGHQTELVRPGQTFGHVSAMARIPRSSSAIATDRCEILEIKWQALRDIMRYSKPFRSFVEEEYRTKNLARQLRGLPYFRELQSTQIDQLCKAATFETYGKSDWNTALRKAKADGGTKLREEVIVSAGDYAEDLILVLGGFARMSIAYGDGRRTLDYKRRGDTFGINELVQSTRSKDALGYEYTLSALGFADIIRLPGRLVLQLINVDGVNIDDAEKPAVKTTITNEREDLLDFLIDNVFVNGTRTMVINQDRCTECDDCVVACANAHEGNPRFVRHGLKTGKFMVANACMHCADPVCMVGCPTGAIHRESGTGIIVINDQTCIGCATCANNCPYDNIRITNIRGESGELILDESHRPIAKATKCDFCVGQRVAPACEYACPNNALKRIDPQNLDLIKDWLD